MAVAGPRSDNRCHSELFLRPENVFAITFARPFASKSTRATNEQRRLIFEDYLTRRLVFRLDNNGDGRSLAFVEHLEEPV